MVILVMKMSVMVFGAEIGMGDSNSGDEDEHDGVWLLVMKMSMMVFGANNGMGNRDSGDGDQHGSVYR